MKMSACWMFIMLLSCKLSHAIQLNIISVHAGDNVPVPCPKLTEEDTIFSLLKNEEEIVTYKSVHGDNSTLPTTTAGVVIHEDRKKQSFHFTLMGVNASIVGVYKCEAKVIRPPPIMLRPSTVWVLVQVKENQCASKTEHCQGGADGGQTYGFPWILILSLVLISIYSVAITIIAVLFWVRWRGSEPQSDYMNTKPRTARDHRKKKGVLNFVPRHC
ncbi:hypothetical protein PBY51_016734 [Eleginops maclovinus]|uniref:Uncharacterized protein n=1 Tax=Eleginops maclovinus TaxID=56733 RepID=A0AAN7W8B9_ELEMC|nr:hypothetical protein PBY51_016734 [Eleginops maclovinus]